MSTVLRVAWRELVATVMTKGFILGILLTPVLIGIMLVFLPALMSTEPPKVDGELAVIDPTGEITNRVRAYLAPEEIARRHEETAAAVKEAMPDGLEPLTGGGIAPGAGPDVVKMVLGTVPEISVRELPAGAELEAEKASLLEGTPQDGGRLALAVVAPNAVTADARGRFGAYELYVREKLDDRIIGEIKDALREAIVEARLRSRGLDPDDVAALVGLPRVKPKAVTRVGEREDTEVLNELLPMAFMLLLMMSTLTSGQYLMTTTIEEKSSRVVELLLSAVSPMKLMAGKITGQLAVGLIVMALYGGMGVVALVSFSMAGLVNPMLVVYLLIFYFIAYFVLGSFMAAIGAAVNDMREAQSLMMPVMLVVMVPWVLAMPISRHPNSLFATVASLVPPINPFVMMLRLTSTAPPPAWQAWLSIAIGVASVFGAVWMAAKVFRIGILMHGKPPNLATLVRWLRLA